MFDPAHARVTCRLCGGEVGQVCLSHTQPDRFERAALIPAEGYMRVWRRCQSCAALMNVQRPEDENRLEHLTASYYEVDLGSGIKAKYDKVMALPAGQSDNAGRVGRVLDACERHLPAGSLTVLDVGAGTGVFLSRFLKKAEGRWRGIAIEPDPMAAEHLRSLERFQVVEGKLDEVTDLPPVNLITFNKVIEHIPFPLPVLKAAMTRMRPDGLIYVEVPDALTADRRPPDDNILGALHKHLYEPESLARLLRLAGFVPLEIARIVEPSGKLTVFGFASRLELHLSKAF